MSPGATTAASPGSVGSVVAARPRDRVRSRWRRPSRIPVFRQNTATDCAATCLRMTLAHHGRILPPGMIASVLATGRDGASAWALLEAARSEGLGGRGLRLSAEAVHHLSPGSILHWDRTHFVVFERFSGPRRGSRSKEATITVIDPALGRCRLPQSEFARRFGGIALELWPGDDFEPRARPVGPYRRYLGILLGHPRLLLCAGLMSLLLLLSSLAVPLCTMAVVDWLVPQADPVGLWTLVFGALAVVLAHAVVTTARGLALVRLHDRFDGTLVPQLVERLLSLPASYFGQRSLGDLMMRVASTNQLRDALTQGAVSTLMDGTLVVVYLVLLSWMSPEFLLVTLGLTAAHLVQLGWSQHGHRRLTSAYLHQQAQARGALTRILAGMETLKATGSEPEAARYFGVHHRHVRAAAVRRGRFNAWFQGVASGLRLVGPLSLLVLGAHLVMQQQLSLGAMLGGTQLALAFLTPLSALLTTAVQLQVVASHAERVEEIYATPPEDVRAGGPVADLHETIELRGVSVRYGPTCPWALEDVDLTIESGQRVAVVGASGSGKSTLARVLLGTCPAERGTLTFGGVCSTQLDLRALRRQIGVVTQDTHLLDLTIADNIGLGVTDVSRAQIEAAAAMAQIHNEIEVMPMGYDTRLADGGSTLSGGQRQRLALARALVRRPGLLLLDEATSALDAPLQREILDAVRELGATVVTIAHRLSTVRDADLIVVMHGGRIVEQGTHRQLVTRGGHYRRLVEASRSSDAAA